MNKRIIYPNADGGLSIIIPASECGLTVEDIAVKDTPTGTPFRIIDALDIPVDRAFREAWTADFSNPDGYGG